MLNYLNLLKKSKNLLGINRRNIEYILPFNTKKAIYIADSKILTKKVLKNAGLPVAETYTVLRNRRELQNFDWQTLPNSFVIKPNRGMGGEGILIVYSKNKEKNYWVKSDKSAVTIKDLINHVLTILDGDFSRINIPDIAIFEERIKIHPVLKPYSYRGIPDVRVIVFNNVPIMAELRLPTRESDGSANLHRGGIGAGIDMASGITTNAVWKDTIVHSLPNKKLALRGIKVPFWNSILKLAIEAQKITSLGFMGIDVAIDREKGPVILEINARPGLSIQIANLSPLEERLKRVTGLKIKTIKQAIRLSKDLFGGQVEEELEEISGKKIIGIKESIIILGSDDQEYKTVAKIDTGAYYTSVCFSTAEKLGLNKKIIDQRLIKSALGQEERQIIKIKIILDGIMIDTEATMANREHMPFDTIIGKKDLKNFLVDPSKNIKLK